MNNKVFHENIDKEKYKLKFIDTSKCSIDEYYNLEQACNKEIYEIDINLYRDNLDNVFFIPDKINMQIYEKIKNIARLSVDNEHAML